MPLRPWCAQSRPSSLRALAPATSAALPLPRKWARPSLKRYSHLVLLADALAPSTCCLRVERIGMSRTRLARRSGCRGNLADVGPHLERTRPCGSIFSGGDVVAAKMEVVGDLVVGGEETLGLPR